MALKVQGTRNDSVHRFPPSFLSAKTLLQDYKRTGLNQAYFTRSLIINTFFASSPGVNFIQEYAEVLHHYFTQCVCTGHTGVGYSLSVYIYYELLVALSNIFLLFQESFYCDLSSLANWAQLRHVSV